MDRTPVKKSQKPPGILKSKQDPVEKHWLSSSSKNLLLKHFSLPSFISEQSQNMWCPDFSSCPNTHHHQQSTRGRNAIKPIALCPMRIPISMRSSACKNHEEFLYFSDLAVAMGYEKYFSQTWILIVPLYAKSRRHPPHRIALLDSHAHQRAD